jgi:hypothetical protein
MTRLIIAAALAIVAPLLAAEIRLSDTENLAINAPDGWTARPDRAKDPFWPFVTIRISPGGERNAVCLISILDKNREEFKDPETLRRILLLDTRPYVPSAEDRKKVEFKKLTIAAGLGFYANFTDPDLVGKPIKKGSYKTATPLVISLGSDYLIKATILCDDLDGPDYAEALKIVESLKVKKLTV